MKTCRFSDSVEQPDPTYTRFMDRFGEYKDEKSWMDLGRTGATESVVLSVLDLGCGVGALALPLVRAGCTVHAVDANPFLVQRLRETEVAGLTPHLSRIESLNLGKEFQLVVMASVLLNAVNTKTRQAFIRTAGRHMAADGVFAVEIFREEWLHCVQTFQNDHQQITARTSGDNCDLYTISLRYFFNDAIFEMSSTVQLLSRELLHSDALAAGMSFTGKVWDRTPLTEVLTFRRGITS